MQPTTVIGGQVTTTIGAAKDTAHRTALASRAANIRIVMRQHRRAGRSQPATAIGAP